MSLPFKKNDVILFTGDSITDCDRNRNAPDSLGMGYAGMVAGRLGADHPELNLRFINRGISGDRTCDLLRRWDAECIGLEPDWVSILVGVNNTWRRYDHNDPTPDAVFEDEYRLLLKRLADETKAKVVICSPFLLPTNPQVIAMREDLDPKIAIVKKLAADFGAAWVDFDLVFVAALGRHIPAYWASDGVHPTVAGHALMADAWIRMVAG
ncbi:MAG: SGNH/GDSL hydrolase family protein [Kiritimatiellales bacterium]|nr:SGNH/GDSL hydrolase family protein [Kiritimatiellales bacterium]